MFKEFDPAVVVIFGIRGEAGIQKINFVQKQFI